MLAAAVRLIMLPPPKLCGGVRASYPLCILPPHLTVYAVAHDTCIACCASWLEQGENQRSRMPPSWRSGLGVATADRSAAHWAFWEDTLLVRALAHSKAGTPEINFWRSKRRASEKSKNPSSCVCVCVSFVLHVSIFVFTQV